MSTIDPCGYCGAERAECHCPTSPPPQRDEDRLADKVARDLTGPGRVVVPPAWQHTATLDAAEYQLMAMALAELSLNLPGFEVALRCLAAKFEPDARPLFDAFRAYRGGIKR